MQQSEFIDICYTCEMTEYYLLSISSNQNSKHLYVIKRSWTLLIYVSFGRQLSELSKNSHYKYVDMCFAIFQKSYDHGVLTN